MSIIIKSFKGGSISSTSLIKKNNFFFVRKKVSLSKNREFGFIRWLSQMKKMQYYNSKIKNIFPKIYDAGTLNKEAFFDIKYFDNAQNCFEYLNSKKNVNVKNFLNLFLKESKKFYKNKIPSIKNNLELYVQEELLNRHSLLKKKLKKKLFKYPFIFYNGEKLHHLEKYLIFLNNIFIKNSNLISESFVHGNLTLENMLIYKKKIIFIDPYEENYVDTIYNDYSQILQSCNSNYELLNKSKLKIKKNIIFVNYKISKNIKEFNLLFKKYLIKKFSFNEIMLIRAFEISQYIRMIPFKLAIDPQKAILFYGLACKLIKDLFYDFKNKKKFL